MDELQQSYEQFLQRMERYKNKRTLVVLFKLLCIGPVLIVKSPWLSNYDQTSCSARKEELPKGFYLVAASLPMAA